MAQNSGVVRARPPTMRRSSECLQKAWNTIRWNCDDIFASYSILDSTIS